MYVLLKETPRTTVTSSLNEISTDKLGKKMVVKGQALFHPSGQLFKDDMNGFFSISVICFMYVLYLDTE